jgi:amino acid transporter
VKFTPRWVSVALAVGAVIAVAWAPFIYQFTSEVASDRRSKAVLVAWTIVSIAAALLALVAAIGVFRNLRSSRVFAWIASLVLVLTLVGAIPGIAALMGLWSSRDASKP